MSSRSAAPVSRRDRSGGDVVQELSDDPGDDHRVLEVGSVVGIVDGLEPCIGADDRGHPLGQGDVLPVSRPCDEQHRHRHRCQAVPQGRLGSRAGQTQAGGEALPAGLAPEVEALGFLGHKTEEGLGYPGFHELVEVDCGTVGGVELVGQGVIGSAASHALGGSLDAGRARHQDQASNKIGTIDRQLQDVPGPHGVAQIVGYSTNVTQERSTVSDIGAHGGRVAVAGQVDGHDLAVPGQFDIHAAPDPIVLGESVSQHQATAVTLVAGMEHQGRTAARRDVAVR